MGQSMKRTLFAITVVVFLLPACTAAPAATQDPALAQQLIEESVGSTIEAEHARATEQQALLPTVTPTPTATFTPGPVDELPDAPTFTPTSTPVISPTPLPSFTPIPTMGYDVYCDPLLLATQTPQLKSQLDAQLKAGETVIIQKRVNLRTQPSRLNRIILVLKPGTEVKIIGGPVETLYDIGKYVWWNIEIPGGLQGWSAELSICSRYYFIAPSTITPTPGGS